MNAVRKPRLRHRSRAFVLLTVLVVVMLSSMLAVSLLFALKADVTAQTAGTQQEQAWNAAMSGVNRAMAVAQASVHGEPAWQDNAAAFQNQFVGQDGDDQWFFTVYSASDSFTAEIRYGLTDESAKLNVYHADPAWLANLPHLNAELVQALLPGSDASAGTASTNGVDTLDSTSASTARGGTNDPVADALASPASTATTATTAAPARPAGSLEELFALAGLDPQLLYGEDANLNLRLDPNENDGDAQWPPDDGNGQLDLGLQADLTLASYDLNVDSEGKPRVNLAQASADLTQSGLPQVTLDYLDAMKRAGQTLAQPADLLEAEGDFKDKSGKPVHLSSGINRENLATLLDRCTTTNATQLPGLLNVNTASREVLTAIPAIGEALADSIIASRQGLSAEEAQTPAWLYRRGLVSAEEFKKLAPMVTTRSRQFSFRCVGYAVPSGRCRVLSVMVDVAAKPARILAVHDLTRFGFPVPLEVLQSGDAGSSMTAMLSGTGGR